MNQLTFVDKIQVLFKLLFSSPIIIGIFAFSMILMIVLFFYSRFNKKIIKYVFSLIYISLIGFAVFKYGKYFLTGIDSFLTLFMANIYFPIIPVYVVIMFISFIIMVITLGSKKKSNVVKIINTVFFTMIQMLFALFIYIVESNKIDLSSNTGLYSNEQTMTLLELGMGLFVVWIIILLVIFYLKKADKIFKVKRNDEQDDFDEYINDYNEPKVASNIVNNDAVVGVSLVQNNFSSDDIVKNLVPETSNYTYSNSSNDTNTVVSNNSYILNNNGINNVVPNNSYISNNNGINNAVPNNSYISNNNGIKNYDNMYSSFDNTTNSNIQNKSFTNIFDGFDFLDVQNKTIERKDDDVEIIDFD